MYGKLVLYTHCRAGKGDHPASQRPEEWPVASGRLPGFFPLKHLCAHLHLGQLSQHNKTIQLCTNNNSGPTLANKSVCTCGVLCLYKSTLCTMVQCAAVLCSDIARLQFDAAECNMSSVQFFSAMLWCTVQWTWHGFIIS